MIDFPRACPFPSKAVNAASIALNQSMKVMLRVKTI